MRDALGPGGKLRVDANGAWTVDQAERAIRALDRYDLEYVEQPVATLEEMAQLRRRVDVPLAADESVRTAEDPCWWRASRPPTSWFSRCSRSAAFDERSRSQRPAGLPVRGFVGTRDLGRHRGRDGARRSSARTPLRLRACDGGAARW